MTIKSETSDMDLASPLVDLPELVKMPAVNKFTSALVARGMSKGTAEAISIAVCDPAAARRQLDEPAQMKVSGGALEVIYTTVWTPALLLFPDNPRMLPGLSYAVENREGKRRPLPPARPSSQSGFELVMEPVTTRELSSHLDAQVLYLQDNNNLRESVGNYGIQEPLLLVPLAFEGLGVSNEFAADLRPELSPSGADLPTILTSVDGNSRLAAAYKHLGLQPGEVVSKLLANPRLTRQRIAGTLALTERASVLSLEDEAALRAVAAPAAIVVGFRPTTPGRDLGDAIQARLGALHVAPPKPWSAASRYDLLLNVSLEALSEEFDDFSVGYKFTGPDYCAWLAGNLSHDLSRRLGFPAHPDVRAAALRAWFSRRRRGVSDAIHRLDIISGNVTAAVRVNIAAEGALRSFRSGMTATEADNARRVLAALYQLKDLEGAPLDASPIGPEVLDHAQRNALAELAATGRPGPSAQQIMILAFYWFARYRIVPVATRGGQDDRRKMVDVVTAMCRTPHGIRVLIQTIDDGRHGRYPSRVDQDGNVEMNRGNAVPLDDTWIRQTWSDGWTPDPGDSPERDLANRTAQLQLEVKKVSQALESIQEPEASDGLPLVDTVGISAEAATEMLTELDRIRDVIILMRHLNERASRSAGTDS